MQPDHPCQPYVLRAFDLDTGARQEQSELKFRLAKNTRLEGSPKTGERRTTEVFFCSLYPWHCRCQKSKGEQHNFRNWHMNS